MAVAETEQANVDAQRDAHCGPVLRTKQVRCSRKPRHPTEPQTTPGAAVCHSPLQSAVTDLQQLHIEDEGGTAGDLRPGARVTVSEVGGDGQAATLADTHGGQSLHRPGVRSEHTGRNAATKERGSTSVDRQHDTTTERRTWSQPLITMPWPRVKSKGLSRDTELSKTLPSARVHPVYCGQASVVSYAGPPEQQWIPAQNLTANRPPSQTRKHPAPLINAHKQHPPPQG